MRGSYIKMFLGSFLGSEITLSKIIRKKRTSIDVLKM